MKQNKIHITETAEQDNRAGAKITRRGLIENSAITLAGLYAAPVTLTLFTATRATAQSAAQAMNVNVINQSPRDYIIGYTTATGASATIPVASNDSVSFEARCPSTLIFTDTTGINSFTRQQDCGTFDTWLIT